MFRVLVVLCLATAAYCQTACQSCLQQKKSDFEAQMKATYQACLAAGGCTVPTHTTPAPNPSATPDAAEAAREACISQAKTNVAACVAVNYTGFQLPTEEHHEEHGMEHSHGGMEQGNNREGQHNGWHKMNCTNQTAFDTCMSSGHQRGQGQHGGEHNGQGDEVHAWATSILNNCSTPSNNCTLEFEGVLKLLCTCKKNNSAAFMACFNGSHVEQQHEGQQRGRQGHEGGRPQRAAQHGGHGGQQGGHSQSEGQQGGQHYGHGSAQHTWSHGGEHEQTFCGGGHAQGVNGKYNGYHPGVSERGNGNDRYHGHN